MESGEHLALHAWCDDSGLAFDLNGFIAPDDKVAHLEAEGLFSPGVHAAALWQELLAVPPVRITVADQFPVRALYVQVGESG